MMDKKVDEGKKLSDEDKKLEEWKAKAQAPPKDTRFKTTVPLTSYILGCYKY